MLAMQGVYDNGKILLDGTAPMDKAEVLVIFPKMDLFKEKEKKSAKEAISKLEKYRGRITRDIDIAEERDNYLNEKYGSID